MAEISETSRDKPETSKESTPEESEDLDPKTMRKTKPGLKRLFLTLTIAFSFLLALPPLLQSIAIYRSPLPFSDIDLLSNQVSSKPLLFPCQFRAVFVDFHGTAPTQRMADELGFSIQRHMQLLSGNVPVCGTCLRNYTVSVTLDSDTNCIHNRNVNTSLSWQCGGIKGFKFGENVNNDEAFDEYLKSALGNGERVYTVVVVNTGDEVRAVVGKYRHAWILGKVPTVDDAVKKVAAAFVKIFVNGGKAEGLIQGEFMPVGADGKVVLSFNLLNADPNDWVYDWYGAH